MALTKARLLKHDFPVHGNSVTQTIITESSKLIRKNKVMQCNNLGPNGVSVSELNYFFKHFERCCARPMGSLADANIPGKWEKEFGPKPEMAKKWPLNGKLAKIPFWGCILPFRRPFLGHFGLGAVFHFLSHFPGFWRRAGVPFGKELGP